MHDLWNDFCLAMRVLRRSLGFATTSILTLALGIGAATSVFSVVNSVLLRPYPFRDPGQLVIWRETIQEVRSRYPLLPDNYKHYLHLKAHSRTVADAAIFQSTSFATAMGKDHPQVLNGLSVSPNFFSVLGVEPALGRTLLPEEAEKGKNNAIVITWSAWQRLFGGDPAAIGRSLDIGGIPRIVVGVLPKTFAFPILNEMPTGLHPGAVNPYEVFQPLVPQDEELTSDDADFSFLVVARLKPGISAREANTELDGMERAYSLSNHVSVHLGVVAQPLSQEVTGGISKALWLLLGAVLCVLLIACVNLASLQLARSVAHDRDNALRAALGAGKQRLLQTVLAESLILSSACGLGGAVLAFFGVRVFVAMAPANFPRLREVHISWPMLLFAAGLSIVTALLFGSLPALRSLRTDPQQVLQSRSARTSNTRKATATRRSLVGFEVACTVVLLIVASLIARSFSRLMNQDRAFHSGGLLVAEADLLHPSYNQGRDGGAGARSDFVDRAMERLRSNPDIQVAAITSQMPLTGETNLYGITRADHPLPESEVPTANLRNVSPGYFAAMQIPLLRGEAFSEKEREHPTDAILSAKTAQIAWPGEDAVGRSFRINGRAYRVIGIAADARIADLKIDAPVVYLPYWHDPPATVFFLVRSAYATAALAPTIRRELWKIDPEVAIPQVRSLDSQVNESLAAPRFQTLVLSCFGVAALMLAVLGVYGVLAYSVSLRSQEFGVRVALGSGRAALMRLVLMEASYPIFTGLAIGGFAAVGAARGIRSLLYQTSPLEPSSILLSIGLLLVAGFLAALLPAYRACKADPMRALRQE